MQDQYTTPRGALQQLIYTLPCTALATTFYAIAKRTQEDYFHGWASVCLWCVFGIEALLSLLSALSYKRRADNLSYASVWPLSLKIVSCAAGIATILCGIYVLWNGLSTSVVTGDIGAPLFSLLIGILSVAGGGYLCICPLPNSKTQARDAILGMALPVGCVLRVLQLYFDDTTPRNASTKLLLSLAFLVLALYWLSDIRITLGRQNNGYHRIIAMFTSILCGSVALGEMIASPTHGWADVIFLAVSFLFIILKGCYTTTAPISTPTLQENEDTDIA